MPDPFITLADLTDWLGRDVSADDGAVIAIDAACDTVRLEGGRIFNAGTSTIAMDGTGTDSILFPNRYRPINTVSAVTENGGTVSDGYTVTDNDLLLRGTAGAYPRSAWSQGRQNISATFTHGYATVDLPRDVKMVALSLAARIVVQGVAVEETVGADRIKYAGPALDLTKGEQAILRKYNHRR